MTLDDKMDQALGLLHEMKPVLSANVEAVKGIDTRTRALETGQSAHVVKIERIEEDLNGLGARLRAQARSPGDRGPRWITIIEFLVALPNLAYIILGAGGLLTAFATLLMRHSHQ